MRRFRVTRICKNQWLLEDRTLRGNLPGYAIAVFETEEAANDAAESIEGYVQWRLKKELETAE